MQEWGEFLRSRGVTVDLPVLTISLDAFEKLPAVEQRKRKLGFILDHNRRIDDAEVLFVFNLDGYVGNSVTVEIGYALAKNKLIYALHADSESGRDVLYLGYCSTPEELLEKLGD